MGAGGRRRRPVPRPLARGSVRIGRSRPAGRGAGPRRQAGGGAGDAAAVGGGVRSRQVVAVTDRWYESTRPAAVRGTPRGAGSDSLARDVIAAVEWLLAREPKPPKAADLLWRECQLDLAHGWNGPATEAMARFVAANP